MNDFPIDSGRVYVAGLSAEGAAAAVLGMTYLDLYAAIEIHSRLACGAASDMPSAFAAMRQRSAAATVTPRRRQSIVPTTVFQSDGDRTVNSVNSDHIISQSKADETCDQDQPQYRISFGAMDAAWRQPCMVGRQHSRILHRPTRARRQSRNGALLP
jgi:poly(3-hydroxybutyrate) depolymerase